MIELLQKQLIEPSVSLYGAPLLFVVKQGGDLRMLLRDKFGACPGVEKHEGILPL